MRLHRIALSSSSPAVPVPAILTTGGIALSPKTGRLIYPSAQRFVNLYQLPLNTVDRVSGHPEQLTSTTGEDFIPRYSRDGKSIAFGSSRFGEFGIWTVPIGEQLGAALTTSLDATLALGDWAPDGKSLVYFRTTPPGGRWQLYRVATDTGHTTRVTNDQTDDFFPNYSRSGNPDGPSQRYKCTGIAGQPLALFRRLVFGPRPLAYAGRWRRNHARGGAN
jgi:dipeptidyl aminopeptidase/acylaminoacyl peptidase